MEILIKRYNALLKALKTLEKILKKIDQYADLHEELRDSTIQRFEYCVDLFWKVLKEYVLFVVMIPIEVNSPKKVLQECVTAGVLSELEHELCVKMVENRNLTSHTYNESLAEELLALIPEYYALIKLITDRIQPAINARISKN